MVSKQTLNAANLAALGAGRLADLLIEVAEGKADIKRRLRLELLGEAGGERLAVEIGKRLETLERGKTAIHAKKARDFCRDLDSQRAMIVNGVAASHPDLALGLMWRFIRLAGKVSARFSGDDSLAAASFRQACVDAGAIAARARPDVKTLAEEIQAAILADADDMCGDLIALMAPSLGPVGLALLRGRYAKVLAGVKPGSRQHFDGGLRKTRLCLRRIADLEGDVDGYRAAVSDDDTSQRLFAPAVARRLVAAGRAGEAVRLLEEIHARPISRGYAVIGDRPEGTGEPGFNEALVAAVEASGDAARAQALRWRAFREHLDVGMLRAYLKKLPDFDDIEAEEKALDLAAGHADRGLAFDFLVVWPAHARLARLVLEQHATIDGNDYERLTGTGAALAEKYPLAATVLFRRMIDDILRNGKYTRYYHAARHMNASAGLAGDIADWGGFEAHEAWTGRLRKLYSRAYGFWSEVGAGA